MKLAFDIDADSNCAWYLCLAMQSIVAWLSEKVKRFLDAGIFSSAIKEGTALITSFKHSLFVSITYVDDCESSVSLREDNIKEQTEPEEIDEEYPGTAVKRMKNIQERVRSLRFEQLNGDWEMIRKNLLWAGGLKDLTNLPRGRGYTGHSFNDFNHCDLTAMRNNTRNNDNEGRLPGISFHNTLGPGIKIASDLSLGPGGSWSTCMIGCHHRPPMVSLALYYMMYLSLKCLFSCCVEDVAHVQFQARIAFKLVWVPNAFIHFVLVDDSGKELNRGSIKNKGHLPYITERAMNYRAVYGSKYAKAAERYGREIMEEQRKTDPIYRRVCMQRQQQLMTKEKHDKEVEVSKVKCVTFSPEA